MWILPLLLALCYIFFSFLNFFKKIYLRALKKTIKQIISFLETSISIHFEVVVNSVNLGNCYRYHFKIVEGLCPKKCQIYKQNIILINGCAHQGLVCIVYFAGDTAKRKDLVGEKKRAKQDPREH